LPLKGWRDDIYSFGAAQPVVAHGVSTCRTTLAAGASSPLKASEGRVLKRMACHELAQSQSSGHKGYRGIVQSHYGELFNVKRVTQVNDSYGNLSTKNGELPRLGAGHSFIYHAIPEGTPAPAEADPPSPCRGWDASRDS
jgi:hypothetical protein